MSPQVEQKSINFQTKITSLPTRYEPLINTFGDRAKNTFVPSETDIASMKRFVASAQTSGQGKIVFISAPSGSGKSTFVHSLEVFLPDEIAGVVRLPPQHELNVSSIPGYLAALPVKDRYTVVNFDGREAPLFERREYQTFLGALNTLLRTRRDLLVVWPVTDEAFATSLISMLQEIGGRSAFGISAIINLQGLSKEQYGVVLEKILQVANWRLDDAAISSTEVDVIAGETTRVGVFLDQLQSLIATRFDIAPLGVTFPTLVIAVSSDLENIRDICRGLRRADSFYIEASRLLMYTSRSNVAEWWQNRSTDLKAALPHVIALFNAQLVSVSASSLVHAVLNHAVPPLKDAVQGVRADRGNANRVMQSSELYKFIKGEALDSREYGSSVKDETIESYRRIQAMSETNHRDINKAFLALADTSLSAQGIPTPLTGLSFESTLRAGLLTDASYSGRTGTVAIEFHHKISTETTSNKVAIYVLEKLKEYAINYGLAHR